MVIRDKGLGAQFHYLTPGCLQPYLDPFIDSLISAGYAALSISNYYQSIAHFGTWMDFQRIAIGEINEMSLTAFASHRCKCPGGRRHKRLSRRYVARVRRFVDYLVQQRVVSGPPADATDEYPGWLAEFRASLLSYRGLSSRTVEHYVRLVTPLLTILGDNPADYDATSVRRAIDVLAPRYSLSTIQGYTTALRAYLRFLTARGLCPSELEAAVPTIPQWRLSALPRYLAADELERLFAACDTQTSCGLRDRAILLLLGRLGLRAGDIVKMRFEDIDWAEGTLRVCGKGRREVRLPLPQEVGEALLKYVEHAPPRCRLTAYFCAPRHRTEHSLRRW